MVVVSNKEFKAKWQKVPLLSLLVALDKSSIYFEAKGKRRSAAFYLASRVERRESLPFCVNVRKKY